LPDGSLLLKEMFKMNVWGIKGMKIGMWYNKQLMQLSGDLNILLFVRISGWIGLVMLTEWIAKEK
jgi:sporulation protein YlmC with PRC-barrel domain